MCVCVCVWGGGGGGGGMGYVKGERERERVCERERYHGVTMRQRGHTQVHLLILLYRKSRMPVNSRPERLSLSQKMRAFM